MDINKEHLLPEDLRETLFSTLGYFTEEKRGKYSRYEYEEANVYLPGDIERITAASDSSKGRIIFGSRCGYGVHNADSFSVARLVAKNKYLFSSAPKKEVLVLNFANPVNPGGGVRRGARAQEEDLCRQSSLLLSLESAGAKRYYDYNKSLKTNLGSDAIIISPKVEIIKDENLNLLDESVTVAVMTCAAPYIKEGLCGLTKEQYAELLYNRIIKMLTLSAYLGYKALVLGAWGCGAFGNDSALISDLFYKALKNIEYNGNKENILFRRIDFAVLSRSATQYNYKQFLRNFEDFYRDENKAQTDAALLRIKESEVNLDKIRGCLIGGAAGDALGYEVEFSREEQIFAKYGDGGITEYSLSPSGKALISDDTQMTLFTANAVLFADTRCAMRGTCPPLCVFETEAYLDWLYTQQAQYSNSDNAERRVSWLLDIPELYSRRAPGNTCLSALEDIKQNGTSYSFFKEKRNNSKGCGGIMRVAPIGCFSGLSPDSVVEEAAQAAAITHSHSLGYMPAAVLAYVINKAIFKRDGKTLKEIILEAGRAVCEKFRADENAAALYRLIKTAVSLSENAEPDLSNIHLLGEGWVAEETLAVAIYCALKYENDFSRAIITAVNHNGDSDSTGAVTGNILGAWLGYERIDEKWKTNLELSDIILEIADDLCHCCQMSEYSHYYDEDWANKYMNKRKKENPAQIGGPSLDGINYILRNGLI